MRFLTDNGLWYSGLDYATSVVRRFPNGKEMEGNAIEMSEKKSGLVTARKVTGTRPRVW